MILNKSGDIYVAESTYDERDIPKAAGFRWDPATRRWWTSDATKAARLIRYGSDDVISELQGIVEGRTRSVAASRAKDSDSHIPVPKGLEYMPFQRAGIDWLRSHDNVLLGDDMGLGKTIQVIGALNCDHDVKTCLVVCPASLKINWSRELEKWSVRPVDVRILSGKIPQFQGSIVPWFDPGRLGVVIVNYNILDSWLDILRAFEWDMIVCDESHYLKNAKTKRTRATLQIQAKRKIACTGTPIPNRPIEAYAVLNWLDPKSWPSWGKYAYRYCGATHNGYGTDAKGASNLEELQEKLRSTIMIRRLKQDVLTELPAKTRQVIEIPANGAEPAIQRERQAWSAYEDTLARLKADAELAKAEGEAEYRAAVDRLRIGVSAAFVEIARARHDTAIAKAPYVAEHCVDILDGSAQKIIVFAHHHDVIDLLEDRLKGYGTVVVTGSTALGNRQAAVDRFQNDPTCRVFIGNIQAAGVGLTLTAASVVVFGELDWVPGNITQAEDRAHRIGQTDPVLILHIVLDGSLDAKMAKTLVAKQEIIDKALDRILAVEPVTGEETHATSRATHRKLTEEGPLLSLDSILAIHTGLRMLSGLCDGARRLDGMGFNKLDTRIGHSLATHSFLTPKQAALGQRLIRKYRRQLPEEIVAKALDTGSTGD